MQHHLFPKGWDFIEESYAEVTARCTGFEKHLFTRMAARIPSAFSNLKFFRSAEQPEDVYAIYASQNELFAIQIDPGCAVICLWDKAEYHVEIGDWSPDACEEAISFIQEHFLRKN